MVIEFCFSGLLPPPKKATRKKNEKKKKKTSLVLFFISVLYILCVRCCRCRCVVKEEEEDDAFFEKALQQNKTKKRGWHLRKIQNFYKILVCDVCVDLRFLDNGGYDTRARWWVSQQQQSSSTPSSFSFISTRERRFEGIGTWAPIELFSLTKPPPRLRLRTGERRTKSLSRSLVYE